MHEAGILVVEDDEAIATGLVRVLDSQGYAVARVSCGIDALEGIEPSIGLVLLDLGLPDIDGIDVCRGLRAARPDLAILILTARDQDRDVVAGLDAGADDYLVKPFKLPELLARVRAHLRRAESLPEEHPPVLNVAGLSIDRTARRAVSDGTELALRPKEFDLLALLTAEAGRVVTRERIMREFGTPVMDPRDTDNHILTPRQALTPITTARHGSPETPCAAASSDRLPPEPSHCSRAPLAVALQWATATRASRSRRIVAAARSTT